MDAKRTILVVDDEPSQRDLLQGFLSNCGFEVAEAESGEAALRIIKERRPDLVLLDVRLPGISGLEVLQMIRQLWSDLPVVLITAHADLHQAVASIKSGADDYLAKPIHLEELRTVIAELLSEPTVKSSTHPALPAEVIATSLAMRTMLETVAVVARSDAPVLITGESGAGKEVIAELIHLWSPRCDGPLIVANCGGLTETLIESELFGHAKGSFTGASQAREGYFRAAHKGSLFLDEIGELPLPLQPKLLRVLESGELKPVGSDQSLTVNVRLIAATNRDLEQAVSNQSFREDLYYRINVVELRVPPLRERRDDILPLARKFATSFAQGPVRLSPQAMQCLLSYSWPGNVRELRNAIQRACLLGRGDVILPEHLPPKVFALRSQPPSELDGQRLSQVERATILATLEECNDNRTRAAEKLGISRRTLINKLQAMKEEESGGN